VLTAKGRRAFMRVHRKFVLAIIQVLVTAGLLWAAFYKVRFSEFWAAFLRIDKMALLSCVFFFGISCLFRAMMWRVTTAHLERVRISILFAGVIVGYMANNLLPFRAGEIVRTYYLASHTNISAPAVLSTVFIERIFDVLCLALMLLAAIVYGITGLQPDTSKISLISMGGIILIMAIFLVLAVRWKSSNRQAEGFLAQLPLKIGVFLETLAQLRRSKLIAVLLVLSVGAWVCNYVSILFLIQGKLSRPLEAACLLLLLMNIGLLIPSSPGALGVMQVAFLFALLPFGMRREAAIALSFAYQAGLYLFTLSVGLPYFLKTNLSFSKIEALDFKKKFS
jgi:uncharacterized protein (TIRG00374 family)